jgi:hypothetical protein
MPNPAPSSTIISTFGAPGVTRRDAGQAGSNSPVLRPITPGKAVPGSYSFTPILGALLVSFQVPPRTQTTSRPEHHPNRVIPIPAGNALSR